MTTRALTPIDRPGGGVGGGGGGTFCATHAKLINTNKIEANILLFCIVMG